MNRARRKSTLLELPVVQGELDNEAEEPPSRTLPDRPRSPASRKTSLNPIAARLLPTQEAIPILLPPAPPLPETTETPQRTRRRPIRFTDMSQVQVIVLHSLALGLDRGRSEELIADRETADVARHVAEALEGEVGAVKVVPVWDDLPAALAPFDPRTHIVFNLVESLGGRAFTEPEAIRQIRRLGFRYTGVPYRAMRWSSSKLRTKQLLQASGIPTPPSQVFTHLRERSLLVPLPAIVKPVAEGGSMGISQASVVTDPESLWAQVEDCLKTYRQPALVESFIDGRELNVALWGNGRPEILPISEILFTWTDDPLKQIVSFDAKWIADSVEYQNTPGECPARLSARDQSAVEVVAHRVHKLLGLKGFVRIDMRLRRGIPYVLEVNGNPDLAPDAGFFRSASTAGHSYRSMVLHILKLALATRL
jgi:D-alanine-D-alanine ligase